MKKNNKKIIFFCPTISDQGGLEKTLAIYLNYLSDFNNVSLVTNTNNTKRLSKVKKKIEIINPKNIFFLKFRLLNNIFCILKLLKNKNKEDIIFSMQDHFIFLLLKFFGLKNKLIIRTMSAIYNTKNKDESSQLKKYFLIKKFVMNFYKYADLVITFSNNNKFYLTTVNKVKNVEVIYNYFERNTGNKKRKKMYNIFFIGRLVEDKDPEFFLRNCIEISKKYNIKIHIIGRGECSNRLKNISKGYKNLIKLYGFVESPLKKFNKIIDIFCVTSKFDGTPNVLGEAMSYNIPSIAPDKIGLSNLLFANGKYGYLYKPGNNNDFQKKIKNIILNYNKAIIKAKRGNLALKRFSKQNTLYKLNKVINNIN